MEELLKRCPHCGLRKTLDCFQKNCCMKDGLEYWCRLCKAADYAIRREKRKKAGLCHCGRPLREGFKTCEGCQKRVTKWFAENADYSSTQDADYRRRLKDKIFDHYGRICSCPCGCKVDVFGFLTIDHIGGGGNRHRRENKVGSGPNFYRWLIKHNFPEGFRTLCYNCNCSAGHLKKCGAILVLTPSIPMVE